jgi:hypothetical protein
MKKILWGYEGGGMLPKKRDLATKIPEIDRKKGKKKGLHLQALVSFGSPGRARTADLMINSHPLYRLSYRGINFLSSSMARPERFELPTARFVAEYSIQLSYGRLVDQTIVLLYLILVNLYFSFS